MVEVRGLTKRFGPQVAVDDLTFSIRDGEIFGLLGPNGAGKTTTIRMLLGLVRPSQGLIRVAGQLLEEGGNHLRKQIGWVPQSPTLDPLLTGRELLLMMARLYEVPEPLAAVEAQLERFGLQEAAGRLIHGYSGGMKKRLELAAGTIHQPRLLILDEPTASLDVTTRHQLWDLVRELRASGTTVLLTTHYLDEADALCDRVAVLDKGRLLAQGAPAELKRRYGTPLLRLHWREARARQAALAQLGQVFGATVHEAEGWFQVPVDDPLSASERLLVAIQDNTIGPPDQVETRSPSLDQVFARVTGRAFDPVTGTPLEAAAVVEEDGPRQVALETPALEPPPPPEHQQRRCSFSPGSPGNPGPGWLAGVLGFARHNAIFLRRWEWRLRRDLFNQAILLGQPVIWLVLFGSMWEGAQLPWAEGSYLRFMTAGIVMMTVFNVALMGGLEVLIDRERGALERFLVSPVHPMALVTSRFLFVTVVAALQTLLIMATAAVFGVQFAAGWWAVLGLLVLAVLLGAGVASASLSLAFWVPHHGHFFTITGLVGLPAVFLSNAFVPLEAMPGWLASLAQLNPMTYAVSGGRALVMETEEPVSFLSVVAALLLFNLIMLFVAYRAARRHLA
jgi:ABC-2 type transport system ATP-binding protein